MVGSCCSRDKHDGVQGAVELAVAAAVEPVADGLAAARGDRAAPASAAKAASLRIRPGCDQLIRIWAAVIAPTPGRASSSGAAAVTSSSSSVSRSAACASRNSAWRAQVRSARTVPRCSMRVRRDGPQPGAAVELRSVVPRRSWSRSCSGALTISALSWQIALVRAMNGARSGGQQDAHRFAVAASPRLGEVFAGQRFAGGADGVEVVGLGAVAAGRSGRPVDLDDPFAVFEQVGGEPGAEAAGALDRPDAPPGGVFVGEREHPAVAERVGGESVAATSRSGRVDDRDGVVVSVGVDADDGVDLPCQHGHAGSSRLSGPLVGAGPGAVTARQDCDEARPAGSARLLIRPATVGRVGAGSRERHIHAKAPRLGRPMRLSGQLRAGTNPAGRTTRQVAAATTGHPTGRERQIHTQGTRNWPMARFGSVRLHRRTAPPLPRR